MRRCYQLVLAALLLCSASFFPSPAKADFPLPQWIADNVEVIASANQAVAFAPLRKDAVPERLAFLYSHRDYIDRLINLGVLPDGKGGAYEGKVVKVKGRFPIYRVYTRSQDPAQNARSRFGQWWALGPPAANSTKDDYYKNYDVCSDWNPGLDTMVTCWVYPEALLLVGPGQSVEKMCIDKDENYRRSPDYLQVFVYQLRDQTFEEPGMVTVTRDDGKVIGCPPVDRDQPISWPISILGQPQPKPQ